MSTKKLQIIGSLGNSDADTLDGKHASEFASASDVAALEGLVGDKSVSEQVETAVSNLENLAYINEEDLATSTNTINADTLGGYLPSNFALDARVDDLQTQINAQASNLQSQINRKADVTKLTPRNLLDNSDFTNLVNQRGQTSYNSDGYCFDRWVIWHQNGCAVSYDSAKRCVRIENATYTTLYQRVPKGILDPNKKYTQAYGLVDGSIVISTRIDYSPANYDSVEGIMLSDGQTLEIVWTALYEGEYTAETLPEYQPKGYGAELAECQRYFYKFNSDTLGISLPLITGITQVSGFLFPVEMRATPTMSIASIKTWTTSGFTDVTNSVSSKQCNAKGFKYIDLLSTVVTKGGVLYLTADFSADL